MNDLPKGWKEVPLQDLVVFALGGDWGKDCNESLENYVKVKVVRGTEFKNWKTQRAKTAAERCVKKSSLESRNLIKGDIVVEISGGGPTQPVGRTIVIDQKALESSDAPLVCSNFFRQVKLHNSIESSFVNYFLNFTWARGGFDEFQTQTTNLRNLNFTQFLNETLVTLPPLNEQKRIVEKLEKLLGKVEAVQARLDKIPAILKRFRQAVLAAACSGKLTADWRLKNTDVKPANQLLKELALQRIIDYEKAVENAKHLGLKKPRKILSETVPDVELDVDLPSTWTITDVNFLAHVTKLAGFEYTKYFDVRDEGDIPIIRAQNVQMGRFVDENIKYISKEVSDILERSQLFGREILMVFIGAGTGNVCLAPNDRRWHLAPNVAKIDVHGTDTNYLLLYLQSSVGLESTFSFIKATAQPSLSMETIRQIVVCLPPLEEQKEIVRRVENLFKFADQIEARYKKARSYTDRLSQSILAKAFRGELVPQDDADEPATVLLERIKAERGQTKSQTINSKQIKAKTQNAAQK